MGMPPVGGASSTGVDQWMILSDWAAVWETAACCASPPSGGPSRDRLGGRRRRHKNEKEHVEKREGLHGAKPSKREATVHVRVLHLGYSEGHRRSAPWLGIAADPRRTTRRI